MMEGARRGHPRDSTSHTGSAMTRTGSAMSARSCSSGPARHDRPDRRIAVDPRTDLRGGTSPPISRAHCLFTGLATALGAGMSMAFSEGLSDTGNLTGRGSPLPARRASPAAGTFLGGVLHTLPFLIPSYHAAIVVALAIVAVRVRALGLDPRTGSSALASFRSFISVALGGAIIAAVSAALGAVG